MLGRLAYHNLTLSELKAWEGTTETDVLMTGIALSIAEVKVVSATGIAPDSAVLTGALHMGIAPDNDVPNGGLQTGIALDETVITGALHMGITLDEANFACFLLFLPRIGCFGLSSTKITSSSTSIGISVTVGALVVVVGLTVAPSSILGIG